MSWKRLKILVLEEKKLRSWEFVLLQAMKTLEADLELQLRGNRNNENKSKDIVQP